MNLSYAQRLEDYHLACAFAGQPTGFYVDVGAGHPVADNVSLWFYLQGWSGLVIEPREHLLALYRHVRPRDTALDCLVGRETGEAEFHVVERLHGLSSMVEQNARQAAAFGATYSTVRLPVTTLGDLFAQHGVGRIDFLKVDVEGAEADVFAGADWARWRPRIIVGEVVAPHGATDSWREWDAMLRAQHYAFTLSDGLNHFYVAGEETDLAARLPREPAPWHAARHLYEFGRANENPDHPDHALAERLVRAFLAERSSAGEPPTERLAHAFLAALPSLDGKRLMALLSASGPEDDDTLRAVARTDDFRAALGRIAAPFDGGLMLEDDLADEAAGISGGPTP